MKRYDLIVVGGGASGVAASVSAAREGLSVLLIEKFGCLGGAMSNSLVYPFMPFRTTGEQKRLLSAGLFSEMRRRKEAYEDTSWETFKFVFDDMVTEAGVDVLFHATVFKAQWEGRHITSVSVATKSGVLEFEADFFIDASGDGELIAMTECEFQLGRESDGLCQPMTTCFRVGGVDIELYKTEHAAMQEKYKEYREKGLISNPRENILIFFGLGKDIVHFNTTRIVKHDPVNAFEISRAEIAARKQIHEMVSFLKKHAVGFKDCTILYIANHIGVRESRKLKGEHVLTVEELKNLVRFEDSIALGNYCIDIHNPAGTGTTIYDFYGDEYYQIPYRSLLPKEYDNMLVAGRCLSADHEAHSAVRIIPICACMGEAAGTAIAIAKETGTNTHTVSVSKVQEKLEENGAVVR